MAAIYAAQHLVEVWGKTHSITIHQQSKSVWITRGTYMGEFVETRGPTENAAANAWRTRARTMGNP
jgi:hypothetical protein